MSNHTVKPKVHQQGYYTPRHPEKYRGDVKKIRFMSSWELSVHKFLDNNPNVLEWASEEVVIPYVKPTDGRVHKYYVDYWVRFKTRTGEIVTELWEVKPEKEINPPKRSRGKSRQTVLYEELTYAVNKAKWHSAALFAQQQGWKFRLMTEKQIFK